MESPPCHIIQPDLKFNQAITPNSVLKKFNLMSRLRLDPPLSLSKLFSNLLPSTKNALKADFCPDLSFANVPYLQKIHALNLEPRARKE
jgi:hypothetical protein